MVARVVSHRFAGETRGEDEAFVGDGCQEPDSALDLQESEFARLQELANAVFEYLEVFHNRTRRHSSLGMLSPVEYEKLRTEATEVA